MKRYIFGIVAIVAILATSCQKSIEAIDIVGNETTVSFQICTPQMASRAFSDGTSATRLQYAVYNAKGDILNDLTVTDGTINSNSKQVEFQLSLDDTYSVLFWAASPSAPYDVDLATKTMTVDYTGAKNSDENRDAFYYYGSFTVSNGMAPIEAKLNRPFAQLNIGTNDLDDVATLTGRPITHTKVEVPVYTTINFATGEVSGKQLIEFGYAALPTSEAFPYEPATYDYMSMNYLLMGSTKETVDVKFSYATDENGANAKTRTVGAVPVQRNYRTNIYGQLLTGNVATNILVYSEYEGGHNKESVSTIYYTSDDGLIVEPNDPDAFDRKIVSNTYENGVGAIRFDGSLTQIKAKAFVGCSLVSIEIPEGVTTIGDRAFNRCMGMESITLPEGIISIGDYAFNTCRSLESITLPNSVTSLGSGVFYFCGSLESVTLPNDITSIGDFLFYDCTNLASITIPEGVTSIGTQAFHTCSTLTSVTIPEKVASVGSKAFYGCTMLQEVLCKPTTVPEGNSDMFTYKDSTIDCKIYVPTASVDNYKSAPYWSEYAAQIEGKAF